MDGNLERDVYRDVQLFFSSILLLASLIPFCMTFGLAWYLYSLGAYQESPPVMLAVAVTISLPLAVGLCGACTCARRNCVAGKSTVLLVALAAVLELSGAAALLVIATQLYSGGGGGGGENVARAIGISGGVLGLTAGLTCCCSATCCYSSIQFQQF